MSRSAVSAQGLRRPGDLLAARPLIEADSRDRMAAELGRAYGVRQVDFPATAAPFGAVANRVDLPGLKLHYCRYDAETHVTFADMNGIRQMFNLAGAGELRAAGRRLPIDAAATAIMPPNCDFTGGYGDGYAHLVVQYDEGFLRRKAELILGGRTPAYPFLESLTSPRSQHTRGLALTLAARFAAPGAVCEIAVTELAQALFSTFVWEHLGGAATAAIPSPGKDSVGRLEEYMRANWRRALTIEDVAQACDVSVRSVFAHFRRSHGVSPMAFLRTVRLEEARRSLQSPGETSVIDIALACGFQSTGHFARRYRERFGELPSATLRRTSRRASR